MSEPIRYVRLRLDEATGQTLADLAKKSGKSPSDILRQALREYHAKVKEPF